MLDLAPLIPQLDALVLERMANAKISSQQLLTASERFSASDDERILAKLNGAKTGWLVAKPVEPVRKVVVASPAPDPYMVLATDGSQIVADRHEIANCYLTNLGSVWLKCGDGAFARLESKPTLHMELDPSDEEYRSVTPAKVAAHRRTVEEFAALRLLMTEASAHALPTVAMVDGTLILWPYEKDASALKREVLQSLAETCLTARECRIPLVGYISSPGSRDVVNLLRVGACPFDVVNCDRNCAEHTGSRRVMAPCGGVEQILDSELFAKILEPGERSALFASQSTILQEYAPEDRTLFCYLNVGPEIARLEIPHWLAEDADLFEMAVSVIFEQAQQGRGYPICLAEAHEAAVVRGADRELLMQMLEQRFVREGIAVRRTRKAASKRNRSV